MNIKQIFDANFSSYNEVGHDLNLVECSEEFYVGLDREGYIVVVCSSHRSNRIPRIQKTMQLCIECNMRMNCCINGVAKTMTVHIIHCFSNSTKEKNIFLELCDLFEEASRQENQEEALLEVFSILSNFFADKREPSDQELQGLYAELYTIWRYRNDISLWKYWHSNDRMKFDFSISDTVKLEVKSTLKSERKHHFRHDQLVNNQCKIYIISYLLKYDDEGKSLWTLLEFGREVMASDFRKLLILDRYLKNTTEERLKNFKFGASFTEANVKNFEADKLPRFREQSPSGVSNVEYDCILDFSNSLSDREFLETIVSIEKNKIAGE